MDDSPTPLDPRVTWLWRLHGLVRVAMLWLPVALGGAAGLNAVVGAAAASVFALTLVALGLLLAMLWPALRYQHFSYSVREHDLLVQRGVLVRRRSSIPHNRIQHVDTQQGPIERLLGLSSLAVYTAAGMSADGSIPGLTEADAEALRDELARRGGDDGV
ncbi:MAG: PH domain-containing protein [Myxococcota bacterium]|nr:PH domain-containing protein [Myxococcota bacterium]